MRATLLASFALPAALVVAAATRSPTGERPQEAPPAPAQPPGSAGAAPKATADDVRRGEYLVRTGGCGDCHTPMVFDKQLGMPVPDHTRMLSGHPANAPDPQGTLGPGDQGVIGPTFTSFKLPFGVAYAANLTSDKLTGIGGWTEDAFVRAMRTGRHRGGGRPILPPMPWMNVGALTDQDLHAVFAYLQTVPPVVNQVPEPKVDQKALDNLARAYDAMAAQQKAAHGRRPQRP